MSFTFIKEALKRFKTQGALFPSSRSLSKWMLKPVRLVPGDVVVELGAGTGVFTKEIIANMCVDSKLVVFENNTALARLLRDDLRKSVDEGNVILIEDDAVNFPAILEKMGIPKANYVISGLPLGSFDRAFRQQIFNAIKSGMKDDGVYVQFQYVLASWPHVRREFDAKIIGFEMRNLPPAFIYKCTKKMG